MRKSSLPRRGRPPVRLSVEPLEVRSLPAVISYLVVGEDESGLPAHFARQVEAAGGEVRFTVPQIGIAVVKSDDPAFAARAERIPGVRSVVDAGAVRIDRPVQSPPGIPEQPPLGSDEKVSLDEFSALQWNLGTINSLDAWAQGVSGDGVRVAIIDCGFMGNHPDLRFNSQLSRSVMDGPPGETWVSSSPNVKNGWHGTYVAGVIGALDDGRGIVGVSPRADLVAIRVIADDDAFQDDVVTMATVMRGIVYAADINSDVINLSLAFPLDKTGYTYDYAGTPEDESDDVVMTPRDVAEVTRAFRRATDYAHYKGATIVAAAGNEAFNYDELPDRQVLPRDLPHVISVSATGPLGIANDPATEPDVPAYYTNYGRSVIDLAAPGGNIDFDLLASGQLVTVFGITAPAFIFDSVFTTSEDPFPEELPDIHINPYTGTSLAAPHVAGVAALVIEAGGGRMDPDEVFQILKRSADDLGEPGKDAFYGYGRVNAAAAVALAQGHEDHSHGGHGGHGDHGSGHAHHAIGGRPHSPGGMMASAFPPANVVEPAAAVEAANLTPGAGDRITLIAGTTCTWTVGNNSEHGPMWLPVIQRTTDDNSARTGPLTFAPADSNSEADETIHLDPFALSSTALFTRNLGIGRASHTGAGRGRAGAAMNPPLAYLPSCRFASSGCISGAFP
jgi:lantibiotic leader peptide-processing serine protease